MADRAAGTLPAGYVTVTFEDANGKRTSRQYEYKAGTSEANMIALSDALQTLTQLSVVGLQYSTNLTGFASTAAEANSSVKETASVRAQMADGRFHTFNLPALKAAYKSGTNVVTTSGGAITDFAEWFDDGAGIVNVVGAFYVNDGQEISETYHEAGKLSGKVN